MFSSAGIAAARPAPPTETRELGFRHGQEGRLAEALALLRPWVDAHPDDLEARLAAVHAAIELGHAGDAAALLTPVTSDTAPVRVLRAELARLERRPAAVLEALQPLLTAPPAGLERQVWWLAGDALLAQARFGEAAALLRPGASSDARLALLFAQAAYQDGHVDEALSVLEPWAQRALKMGEGRPTPPGPAAVPILVEYGRMLVATRRAADAVKALEPALRWDPQNRQGWLSLGHARAALGEREAAQNALERFRQLDAARPEAERKNLQPPPP